MDYHVLSNFDMMQIGLFTILAASFLSIVFSGLGGRDASPTYKKGIIAKIVPWVLLIIFVSDVAVIISKMIDYSLMNIEPRPSQASVYREMQEMVSDSLAWGYANDEQLAIVGKIGHCVCMLCWTAYAFSFKKSDTVWWKKLFKVIAYCLLSVLIIGFSYHETRELMVLFLFFVLPAIVLLYFARVKPNASTKMGTSPMEKKECDIVIAKDNKEDETRFMPHTNGEVHVESENVEAVQEEQVLNTVPLQTEEPPTQADLDEKTTLGVDMVTDASSSSLDFMYCKYCGKKIEFDSTFCKYCGRKL